MPVREVSAKELIGSKVIVMPANPALIRGFQRLEAGKAREFAVSAHGSQAYGDLPYVEHLESVVSVLQAFGFAGDEVVAGWLHDVAEDTDKTIADIEIVFGEGVAKLVWAVTGGGDRATHVASIGKKIAAFPDAASVKLADRIANVEACEAGDKHSVRYSQEHSEFAETIQPHVPAAMWQRYLDAIDAKTICTSR